MTTSATPTTARQLPTGWTDASIPDQAGRTALVTGANSGLGYLTSLKLAQHGAHVIMAVRDLNKGYEAKARIEATSPRGRVELRELDLADLSRVKTFAGRLLASDTRLDLLVNNAGIMMPPRILTVQGHELQFGVNHLAHFALTGMLLPRLREGASSRVVTISSDLHKRGQIHFDDLAGARRYGRIDFYAQSKFANVLFALELDRRLRASGLPIQSVLAHPGYAATNLQMSGPSGVLKLFMHIGNRFIAQPAEMGVLPQLFAATAPEVQGGDFIGPDGPKEMKGHPTLVRPIPAAEDEVLAARLWQRSVELTGVAFDFARLQHRAA